MMNLLKRRLALETQLKIVQNNLDTAKKDYNEALYNIAKEFVDDKYTTLPLKRFIRDNFEDILAGKIFKIYSYSPTLLDFLRINDLIVYSHTEYVKVKTEPLPFFPDIENWENEQWWVMHATPKLIERLNELVLKYDESES